MRYLVSVCGSFDEHHVAISHSFFSNLVLLLTAPLPNLTSDDIDSALAPASTQGSAYVPVSSVYDSRQHPVITSNPNVLRDQEYGQSPRYSGTDAYDRARSTPTWSSPQQTPSKLNINFQFHFSPFTVIYLSFRLSISYLLVGY